MKKLTTLAISLIVISLTGNVYAASGHFKSTPQKTESVHPQMNTLQLTANQKSKIKNITESTELKAMPIVEKMAKIQQQLHKLIYTKKFNAKQVDRTARRLSQNFTKLVKLRAKNMHAVYNVMTPKQQAQIKKIENAKTMALHKAKGK